MTRQCRPQRQVTITNFAALHSPQEPSADPDNHNVGFQRRMPDASVCMNSPLTDSDADGFYEAEGFFHDWGPASRQDDHVFEPFVEIQAPEPETHIPMDPDMEANPDFKLTHGFPPHMAPESVSDFLHGWHYSSQMFEAEICPTHRLPAETASLSLECEPRRKQISLADVNDEKYDAQGINWTALQLQPRHGHELRHRLLAGPHYRAMGPPALHLPGLRLLVGPPLPPLQRFRFAELATTHVAGIPHNDLRNALACPSVAASFYADRSTVYRAQPGVTEPTALLSVRSPESAQISNTLRDPWTQHERKTAIATLAADRNVLAIGSFDGRYAYASMSAHPGTPFIEGSFHRADAHSINHVAPFPVNGFVSSAAVLCSNAGYVGILDFTTNRVTMDTPMEYRPNAAGVSPDGRSILAVGDETTPLVVDVRSGRVARRLASHQPAYAMACAWSPPLPDGAGELLATGAEDRLVRLYDPRRLDQPLHAIRTLMGGARVLRFSPADEDVEDEGYHSSGPNDESHSSSSSGSSKPPDTGPDQTSHADHAAPGAVTFTAGASSFANGPVLLAAEPLDGVTLLSVGGPEQGRSQRMQFLGDVSGADWVGGGRGRFVVAIADWRYGGLMEFERHAQGEVWEAERDAVGLGWDRREDFDPAALCM